MGFVTSGNVARRPAISAVGSPMPQAFLASVAAEKLLAKGSETVDQFSIAKSSSPTSC